MKITHVEKKTFANIAYTHVTQNRIRTTKLWWYALVPPRATNVFIENFQMFNVVGVLCDKQNVWYLNDDGSLMSISWIVRTQETGCLKCSHKLVFVEKGKRDKKAEGKEWDN